MGPIPARIRVGTAAARLPGPKSMHARCCQPRAGGSAPGGAPRAKRASASAGTRRWAPVCWTDRRQPRSQASAAICGDSWGKSVAFVQVSPPTGPEPAQEALGRRERAQARAQKPLRWWHAATWNPRSAQGYLRQSFQQGARAAGGGSAWTWAPHEPRVQPGTGRAGNEAHLLRRQLGLCLCGSLVLALAVGGATSAQPEPVQHGGRWWE